MRREPRLPLRYLRVVGMLRLLSRQSVIRAILLAVILLLPACGTSSGPGPEQSHSTATGPPSQEQTPEGPGTTDSRQRVTLQGAPWPVQYAQSLRTMVENVGTVIVGEVTGVKETSFPKSLQGTPITISAVHVLRVIASPRVQAGQTIGVSQLGGVGHDGRLYEIESDRLLSVGTTYLFFLQDLQPQYAIDGFTGDPFGRFVINANGLIVPNGWEALAGVSAISGVPYSEVYPALQSDNQQQALAALPRTIVNEAAVKILAAIAIAPLPTPKPPMTTPPPVEIFMPSPTPTAAPVPTPTPAPSSAP